MPAPVRNEHAAQAGRKFRELREGKKWVLRDVETESIRRYGEDGAIRMAQLSRIEKGQFDRVSLDDAVRLGALYGLDPNQVAAMFGLWSTGPADRRPTPISEAEVLSKTLPEDIRAEHLQWIEFANMQARAKARERMRQVPASVALVYDEPEPGAVLQRPEGKRFSIFKDITPENEGVGPGLTDAGLRDRAREGK